MAFGSIAMGAYTLFFLCLALAAYGYGHNDFQKLSELHGTKIFKADIKYYTSKHDIIAVISCKPNPGYYDYTWILTSSDIKELHGMSNNLDYTLPLAGGTNMSYTLTYNEDNGKWMGRDFYYYEMREVRRVGCHWSEEDLYSINDTRLHILQLEVTSDQSLDYSTNSPPSRSLLTQQFDVNTVSVVLLTQKLLPLLRQSSSKKSGDQFSISRSAIINISSGLASISGQFRGSNVMPLLAYSMSKTALNQFTKTLSIDLKEDHILVVSFGPGWIKTDMGGPDAPLTLEDAVPVLVSSWYKLDGSYNGGFYQRDLTPYTY